MEKRTWRARLCSNHTAGCNQPREKRKREEEEGGVDTDKQLSVSVRKGGRRYFLNQRVTVISNWVLLSKKRVPEVKIIRKAHLEEITSLVEVVVYLGESPP